MKTEQEQIKAIKQIIDERVETTLGQVQGRHGNVIKTVDTVIIARDIVDAGYGDISEYKAEIERLRTTLGQCNTELNSALESLKSQCREIGALKAGTKQAKIDILNEVKKCSQCDNFFPDGNRHRYVLVSDIDILIKEIRAQ